MNSFNTFLLEEYGGDMILIEKDKTDKEEVKSDKKTSKRKKVKRKRRKRNIRRRKAAVERRREDLRKIDLLKRLQQVNAAD